jgi:hypothetical protein
MKLQEIFDQLSTGEFSQLRVGGQDMGVINETNYPTVLPHINLALIDIFKRFHLKEGQIKLEVQPNLVSYTLNSIYGESSRRSKEPIRYIKDIGTPFMDDIIKIERVFTDAGVVVPLNDWADNYSCHTPSVRTLTIPREIAVPAADTPDWLRTKNLRIVYRASHPLISIPIGLFDPARVEIDMPYSHLMALLYFIASRIHNPIGMTNEFHAGNSYYAKYLQACQDLENQGLQIEKGTSGGRVQRNGWA